MHKIGKKVSGEKVAAMIDAAVKKHKCKLVDVLRFLEVYYMTYYQWRTGKRNPYELVALYVEASLKEFVPPVKKKGRKHGQST